MGIGEVARLHAVLAVGPRDQPRPVRGAAGHHAARTARVRRRGPRGPRAEVLDAGRFVDAAADRRTPRRATGLRGHGRRRIDAGHQGAADLRRDHLRGARGAALDASSTPTNRAASAHRAARAPTGWARSTSGWKPAAAPTTDIDKLLDISDTIFGKSFCALGDGAASPILSSIKFFRDEYVAHLDGGCPFDPHASTLMAAPRRWVPDDADRTEPGCTARSRW